MYYCVWAKKRLVYLLRLRFDANANRNRPIIFIESSIARVSNNRILSLFLFKSERMIWNMYTFAWKMRGCLFHFFFEAIKESFPASSDIILMTSHKDIFTCRFLLFSNPALFSLDKGSFPLRALRTINDRFALLQPVYPVASNKD